MNVHTFGQMLHLIQLGQIAQTADGQRSARLLPEGLVWIDGLFAGRKVQVEAYLLSDLWTIVEDGETAAMSEARTQWERRRLEMLENQWFDRSARRKVSLGNEE
ncbi:hypothetical protein QWJ34_01790 [Saccharibacillus sp. CPCC 101409]|uniref:hypothetical protein n=1 Tax=Saccharibacillus sp. CPCC 101409 TaxID=3058041 RepID=UPI002671828C|nr:hypothetical protein [Saccharibacillus sp. CPCC 101409]MDO3408492.1 hypothetical protein [Saccharibacillus sp. CPCC 101409]